MRELSQGKPDVATVTKRPAQRNPVPVSKPRDQKCKRCLRNHPPKKCPAFGKECLKCGGKNHFAKACFTKDNSSKLHTVQPHEGPEIENLFLEEIAKNSRAELTHTLKVNGELISFKLDTGAQCNVIPLEVYKSLKPQPELKQSDTKLTAYGGSRIPTVGTCKVNIEHDSQNLSDDFYVVDFATAKPLLGLQTCQRLPSHPSQSKCQHSV